MKNSVRILIAVLLLGVFGVTAAAAKKDKSAGAAAITFAEKKYDFGTISSDGGAATHEFEFQNTGSAPLVIISATASCGCTRPTFPTAPIAPGKRGKIKVTYLPTGQRGEFSKDVKVRTNAPDSKRVVLKISGVVKPSK